jgi:Domain of unknown function (DUF4160)
MYYEFGRHQQPHFHARYGDYKASFTIMPPALLAGVMPRRQQNLVIAWAELHYEELLGNWQAIEKEEMLSKISGLK